VPVILDYKRGDIDSSNEGYIFDGFEECKADAVTVNLYMGGMAFAPSERFKDNFLAHKDKGIIILCRTSNPGAGEFQDCAVMMRNVEFDELKWQRNPELERELGWRHYNNMTLVPAYQRLALHVARFWNTNGNCALVVGATMPHPIWAVRQIVGDDMPLLVPGVGVQGGDLEAVLKAGLTSSGDGLIINASRSVIFAYKQYRKSLSEEGARNYRGENFDLFAKAEVVRLNEIVQNHRQRR
jgi:orotidine-5'-phosphate decarboxylase